MHKKVFFLNISRYIGRYDSISVQHYCILKIYLLLDFENNIARFQRKRNVKRNFQLKKIVLYFSTLIIVIFSKQVLLLFRPKFESIDNFLNRRRYQRLVSNLCLLIRLQLQHNYFSKLCTSNMKQNSSRN